VKELNPSARVLLRTKYLRDEAAARQIGADAAVVDEVESAVALTELVLAETGAPSDQIRDETERIRRDLRASHRPSHR
jgi:hypothetical protein